MRKKRLAWAVTVIIGWSVGLSMMTFGSNPSRGMQEMNGMETRIQLREARLAPGRYASIGEVKGSLFLKVKTENQEIDIEVSMVSDNPDGRDPYFGSVWVHGPVRDAHTEGTYKPEGKRGIVFLKRKEILIINGLFDAMEALVNCSQRIAFESNGELSGPDFVPEGHMVQEAKLVLKRAKEVALQLLEIEEQD